MEQAHKKLRLGPVWWKGPVFLAVGLLLLGWVLNTPAGLLGKADAIGYSVCHRIDSHSFHLGEREFPLCARCSGMYLGAMLGLVYQSILYHHRAGTPPRRVLVVLGLFFLAFGADGVNSFLSLFPFAASVYQPQNWLRLLTGTGMGLVIAVAIFSAFNQTAWKDWDPRPGLPGLRSLAGVVLLALAMDGLVLTGNPLLLYPLALVGAGGVVVLLTMIYTVVWLMVLRLENRYLRLAQLLMPLVGGFGLAMLQIAALDLARFAFTGTWDGFHFG